MGTTPAVAQSESAVQSSPGTNGSTPPKGPAQTPPTIATPALITAMAGAGPNISDLIISPNRVPQVELGGDLTAVQGLPVLTPADTARIAGDLIGGNKHSFELLKNEGSCDLSYALPKVGRFRVNIFRQRGSYAIVMRVISNYVPTFEKLNLPPQLADIVNVKNGIVLVTGPTGSGKSSTLAAIIDRINREKAYHIITIEDPVEFLHPILKATIHQRELHSDSPSFALAMRAALRQAPKVILVGEMRDKETIEIAMTAAETGHLVFSTLHTIDAAKTVERVIGEFPMAEQQAIRNRLAQSFRYIISQRLLPRREGKGRVAAIEILKSTMRTREYIAKGEGEGKSLLDAMRDGTLDGMQHFDGEIERMIREKIISRETGLAYATNRGNLALALADLPAQESEEEMAAAAP